MTSVVFEIDVQSALCVLRQFEDRDHRDHACQECVPVEQVDPRHRAFRCVPHRLRTWLSEVAPEALSVHDRRMSEWKQVQQLTRVTR